MRVQRSWSLIAASILVTAPAGATTFCGGSTFSTCASVAVTKVLLSNGNVRVRIEVLNEAGYGSTYRGASFTRVGLWGVPESAQYVPGSLFVGGNANPNDWRFANAASDDDEEDSARKDGKKVKEEPAVARMKGVRLKRGLFEGLPPGQPAVFEFDLTSVSIDEVNTRDFVLQAELDRCACSTNAIGSNGTVNEARNERSVCVAAAAEAVLTPEPPAFVLLATALAGLTALAWRRFPRI